MQTTEDVYRELQKQMPPTKAIAKTVAASVALLWRHGEGGALELLLVQRSHTMRFLPGFWAFPGGKEDPEDDSAAHAAARELAEETGVIVATDALVPLGRWITPEQSPLRYDTQYFLAQLPDGQVADYKVSDGELIDSVWIRPVDALERFEDGTLLMSSPVLRMLGALEPGVEGAAARTLQAAKDEEAAPRSWPLVGGIAVSPLRTPTLPPATSTNCYLIDSREFIVIDPATPHADERSALCRAIDGRLADGDTFAEIWLTHHHGDHVGAAEFLANRYGVRIAAHALTAELLDGVCRVDRVLVDGEKLTLAGPRPRMLECLFTPGHAPGHLCFYEHHTRAIVAGDMVASTGTILIDPSEGDMAAYLASLQRLRDLKASLLLPAHGIAVADPERILKRYLAHRHMREDKVLAALCQEPQPTSQLVTVVYEDTPAFLHPLAERSLLSHLVKLHADGKVSKVAGETVDRWQLA